MVAMCCELVLREESSGSFRVIGEKGLISQVHSPARFKTCAAFRPGHHTSGCLPFSCRVDSGARVPLEHLCDCACINIPSKR